MSALRDAQSEFLLDVCKLVAYAVSLGFQVTGGELQRTIEQAKLYQQTGFSKAGEKSFHCKKCAIDLSFFLDGQYIEDKKTLQPLGDYWESLHPLNSWGGNFKGFEDCPHFSRGVEKPERNRG